MKTRILTILSPLLLVATLSSETEADTVKIDLPTIGTYPTISAAYTAAADRATIMLQGTTFNENLDFGAAKTIFLKGGYDTDFTPNTGDSIVRGTFKVSGGAVHVQQIVVRDAGSVPGAPTGVTATAGSVSNTVSVSIGATNDGGSPITGYTVTSSPAGITATGSTSPVTVTCPSTCTGYAFSVFATNAVGNGATSALTDVITSYDVVETFFEPDTQPNNSIFIGSFTFNSTTSKVLSLQGILSESMTGGSVGYPNDTMTWLPLTNQLSSVYDQTLGGLLVTTFRSSNTNTFSVTLDAVSGWTPADGITVGGLYYGFPIKPNNPGNAYAMIFVNTADPTTPLTQAQIDKLAYADCAPGGMMGAVCMTGTTVAGYGKVGTMHGYPISQVITKQP